MRLAGLIAVSFALLVTAAAAGIGPSLPDVNGAVSIAEVSYVTTAHRSGHHALEARRGQGRGPRDALRRLGCSRW